ncbi:MAG: metalloregulator ArsR/SmtB family transcription factor [Desulfobacter sp.]|nr:MAG: metalloregulator ArsR/SmtB family transcription factor [Desulfobacter sp.]
MEIIKQFKALSDPTRLRLVNILDRYELNVNEIVSVVEMIQSGVSRHLRILLEAGLLASRKDGSYIYYSAAHPPEARAIIELACARVADDPLFSGDLARADQCLALRKNRAKRFFKTVAPQWDRLKKEVLGEFDLNGLFEDHILEQGPGGPPRPGAGQAPEPAWVVADLGCGTGEMLSRLLDRGPGTFIGVDASPEMLEQARIRLPERPDLELRLGELENLPMREREVDTAVMSMVLYHIYEPAKSIQEVYRVLRPGGAFLLADFLRHTHEEIKEIIGGSWLGFTRKQIKDWLCDAGFSLSKAEVYPVEKDLSIIFYLAHK